MDGEINTDIPENATHEGNKIERLGFASVMSNKFFPVMNLIHFDAFELRVRVVDKRTWISNIGIKGDDNGEMYQALFSGDGKWTSVILPFHKYLFTCRGMLAEHQQNFNQERIQTMGLLQAERTPGPFCIQIESIRALSLAKIEQDVRYDPSLFPGVLPPDIDGKSKKMSDFDYANPKPKDYYKVIKY